MSEPKPDWSQMETRMGDASAAVRSPSAPSNAGMFPVPVLSSGTVLAGGRYEILQILGEGGMGTVYKAHDRELDRVIALKTIRPELASNADIIRRFKQELILARQIAHRNVVRLYDIAEGSGVKFITMEYVEGEDLRSILKRRGKLPPEEAVEITRQICLALEGAHNEGVIHRDLKPQNIMRDKQGRIVVMDFGLARALESGGLTQTGALVGTMEYMSPEQAKGESVGATSDIYAAGLIFYELLTGQMPYAADSALASLLKRAQQRAIPASEIDKTVPRHVSTIVGRCIEPDRLKRYQNAGELLADLEVFQPSGIRGSSTVIVRRRPAHRYAWAAVGVVLLAIAAAGVFGWKKFATRAEGPHAPVSVLVGDFTNHTGDPIFDETLEPMFNVALEGASFINAYNRGQARRLARKLPNPTDKLDEQAARLVAVSQGLAAVVTGALSRRGDGYKLSVEALDARTGNSLASAEMNAANKDEVLLAIPKLVAPIRKALGDTTPESVQLAATLGSFTTASIETVHLYGHAMEQQFAGNMEEALRSFTKAAELDPNFARAYSGMAALSGNLGQFQDAEKYVKLAMAHVDRISERERYRVRGLYYSETGNLRKCIEEYGELLRQYPSDTIGHNNLAGCYARLQDMPKAIDEARRTVQISPKDVIARMNLSLYECYAGDFGTSERDAREVQQINPAYEQTYLVVAYAQLGQGQVSEAADTYRKLEKLSPRGASLAASGLANIALYQGRLQEALQLLERGLAADLKANKTERAADKLIMMADAQLLRGDKLAALAAANRALSSSKKAGIRLLAARIFVAAGQTAKARELASGFSSEVATQQQAYAKLIEGEIALQEGRPQEAIQSFSDANKFVDTWIGRFDLGRAYLQAGAFAEADSEFEHCLNRRGEAMEFFMDDLPTYSYVPPVYYYQGRVRDGLKSPGAADSYRTYLSLRGKGDEHPLLADVHRRLAQ